MQGITDYLPADAVLLSDTGHSGIWTGTMIDLNQPTQTFLRCAGSLGLGLPRRAGGQVRRPRPAGGVLSPATAGSGIT